ncbi:hypothetical protein FA09DRAFT_359022 [Tilletiopsis washingtonensis]|uniref:BTB domain-containing protein n=1 Tax=Tilletiopsis washingtonensis TaxID=58919 RepID=A0A316ZH24_9BASI|nr:hypothetical protein FA09DRAFT_359022 [Tilletiopsis washingtonensis]PWN99585.1 hypothetical protein FA09DRAFT_359022 [Tilletiopsis washingtonensis]
MADKPVSVLDLLAAMKIEVTDEKVASAKLDYVLFPKEKNDSGTFATTFGVDLRGSTLLLLSRARKSGILFESAVLKEHCAFFRNMLSSDFLEGTAYRSRKRARTSRSEPASGTHAESASSIFERSVVTLCDVAQYKYTGKLRQKMPIWDMVPLLRATDYYDIKDLGGAALADWKLLQGLSSDQMARAISMVLDRTICGEHLLLQELSKYLYALETTTAQKKSVQNLLRESWPEPNEHNLLARTIILVPLLAADQDAAAVEAWLDEAWTASREDDVQLLDKTFASLSSKHTDAELAKLLREKRIDP